MGLAESIFLRVTVFIYLLYALFFLQAVSLEKYFLRYYSQIKIASSHIILEESLLDVGE